MYRTMFFALMFFAVSASAQDSVLVMTLEEALQIAKKQQPDLLNAERNIAYAKAATNEAKSSYKPKVTLEADYRYNPIIQTNVLPANAFNPANDPKDLIPIRFGTPWNGVAGVRVKQPIYDPAKLTTLDGNKLGEELAIAQQKKLIAEQEEEIVKAWYSIMLSQAKAEYYLADLTRNKKNAEVIAEQLKQGRALEQDLREASLQVMESDIELERTRMDVYSTQVYLSYMMGYDKVQLILPKEKIDEILPAQSGAGSTISGTSDPNLRPDVQEQSLNARIAQIDLQQTKAGQKPTLNFEGYLGANNFSYRFNPFTNWYGNAFLGLVFRYPIFGSGEKKSQIEQSRLQYENQKESLRKLQQQAYYETVNSGTKASYNARLVGLQKERLKVQEEKIGIVRNRLQEGRALPQDLLNEETKLVEIRKDFYQYAHDFLTSIVEYRKASGKSPASNQ